MDPSDQLRLTQRHIGPYRLEHLLGRGGMGEVWKARDERLDRWVAVKRLHDTDASEQTRARFRREARTLARLVHPAIVQIFDVVEDVTGDLIVMELVEGPSLRRLAVDEPLDLETILDYARQIALGLAAAHEQGIIHLDLKTENVLLRRPGPFTPGQIKIVDFGLAKWQAYGSRSGFTISGQLRGTPRAMAPEQAKGTKADQRSDLFSFGVLLYELLAGHSPFEGLSVMETLQRLGSHHPPPVERFNPRVPSSLSQLIDRMLAKEPGDRPENAGLVVGELDRAQQELDGTPSASPSTTTAKLRTWQEPDWPQEPYPVLLPYTHPGLLVGRSQEIARLRRLLRMPIPLLGLCAPSGIGKSSLLAAGLVPALRRDGHPVALIRHPQDAGLAHRLIGDLLARSPAIGDGDVRAFVAQLATARQLAGKPPILLLDQFEDVLKDFSSAEKPSERNLRTRALLGRLLAATVARRPGLEEPLCHWVLAYRQEYHGKVNLWLRDVLSEAGSENLAELPRDLSGPERFHSSFLRPLGSGESLEWVTSIFQEIIEKPLESGPAAGRWRFAPGHAERLARAFAEARMRDPEAALTPELQVVLAFLLRRAGNNGDGKNQPIEIEDDPSGLIDEALENHLRQALESAFPAGDRDVARRRARALLALRELVTVPIAGTKGKNDTESQRTAGLPAEALARVIGDGAHEVLETLSQPLFRLVVLRETPQGLRYILPHDSLANAVVRVAEEEAQYGGLLVDSELLALRRLVGLRSAIFQDGDEAATRLSSRQYRLIADNADALVRGDQRHAWWAACQRRRSADRHRYLGWAVAALALVFGAVWLTSVGSQRRASRQALMDRVVQGEPTAAFKAVVRLLDDDDVDVVDLIRQRQVPLDILDRGLGGFDGDERHEAVLNVVERVLPWASEPSRDATQDIVLIATMVWALDFGPGRAPAFADRARELRRAVLAPLRQRRPPPTLPGPGSGREDWADIPGGVYQTVDSQELTLSPFRMLRHEVTNAEYRGLFPNHPGADDLPAGKITWYDAYTYAAWLGGRLPTAAEWEYAALGSEDADNCDRANLDDVAWTIYNSRYESTGDFGPHPVRQLQPNAWGLFDMLGNVSEWIADGEVPTADRENPWRLASNGTRFYRGGNFLSVGRLACATYQEHSSPTNYDERFGFRVLLP